MSSLQEFNVETRDVGPIMMRITAERRNDDELS